MTSTPSTRTGRRSPGTAIGWRLRLSGLALVYVLLAVPALVMLVLLTVSLGVVPVFGVGAVLLLVLVPVNEQLANVHRALSGQILGVHIESSYVRTGRTSPYRLLRTWARDSARWRDYLWTWACVTVAWAISGIAFGLVLGVLWYLFFPFVFAVTPDGVFDIDYGIFRIDSVATSFLEWIWLVVAVVLWWWLTPILMRWRAQIDRALLSPSREELERRVEQVSQSRTATIDHSAAELRRIERDLHDGAQARMVSLGMSLGMAEKLLQTDPDAAAKLLEEARLTTTTALGDLRTVVRGIHPPVLADRGLAGAVQALALDLAIPVAVTVVLPGRPPAPVETAAYFAVAECLANVVKHASAHHASVELTHDGTRLRIVVADNGRGGADLTRGTGLAGVARRLDAFDGTMGVVSPAGGPTVVTMELPCVLSSPRTSPSSGTA